MRTIYLLLIMSEDYCLPPKRNSWLGCLHMQRMTMLRNAPCLETDVQPETQLNEVHTIYILATVL